MNIDKFRRQHAIILDGIAVLRELTQDGVAPNAERIAAQVIATSGIVKLHLAVEDSLLYPALAHSGDARLAAMGEAYSTEMQTIARDYFAFAARWNLAGRVASAPEAFRADANRVLRRLHERMRREERDFYPSVASSGVRLDAPADQQEKERA